MEKFVPKGIDLLITESTMLSRGAEAASNPVQTAEQPGQRAEELFRRHKYNFVLGVLHLFLNCEEVSFQEFTLNFGVSRRTARRDTRWDRTRRAFIHVTQEPFPLEEQENKTRLRYLEKLGYKAWYFQEFDDEPGRWYYEIPDAYGLNTIPRMKQ